MRTFYGDFFPFCKSFALFLMSPWCRLRSPSTGEIADFGILWKALPTPLCVESKSEHYLCTLRAWYETIGAPFWLNIRLQSTIWLNLIGFCIYSVTSLQCTWDVASITCARCVTRVSHVWFLFCGFGFQGTHVYLYSSLHFIGCSESFKLHWHDAELPLAKEFGKIRCEVEEI